MRGLRGVSVVALCALCALAFGAPPASAAPPAVAAWVEDAGLREATLQARINPEGLATTYHLEWGATPSYGNSTGELPVGADGTNHTVSHTIEGLEPGMSYHWRLVATNETAPTDTGDRLLATFSLPSPSSGCQNEALRFALSAALPDCRAYELVSPLDKNGGNAQALPPAVSSAGQYTSFKQSALDGEKLTYSSSTAFGDAVAGAWANQYIASRGSAGWSNHGISPPRDVAVFDGKAATPLVNWDTENLFEAFTPDLCDTWVKDTNVVPLVAQGLTDFVNVYRRSNCGAESLQALTNQGPFGPATEYLNDRAEGASPLPPGPGLRLQGYSADLEHQVFVSGANLTPDGIRVGRQLECIDKSSGTGISSTYQWLRNGAPVEGATVSTYTVAAADAGASLQCQITVSNASAGSTQTAGPPGGWVVEPAPATLRPIEPPQIAAPTSSSLTVGGPGGQTLTCDPAAGDWRGSPTFSYRWYRSGVLIAGATAQTYQVTAGDLATRAAFQCAVVGTNAGGSAVKVSGHRLTAPAPAGPPTPTANAGMQLNTQLYDLHDGVLELVSILPGGFPNPDNSYAGILGTPGENRRSSLENAVSTDGSRIFWTSSSGPFAIGPGELYVRVDGNETLPISNSVEPGAVSRFLTAAADGSAVLFSIGERLYEFDVDAALAGAAEPERLIADQVPGALGAADDLSRIYFVSREALVAGAQEGEWNLYLEEEGDLGVVTILSSHDVELATFDLSPIQPQPVLRPSRVTPDGRHIAFQALGSLTGYDNVDPADGKRYTEVFRYDADSDELTCVSCNPTGVRPQGGLILVPYSRFERTISDDIAFNESYGQAALLPTCERELYCSHVLSDDGGRVFFHSFEALVARDTNGVRDVYQWEAQGTGGCGEPDGCVDLISTGTSPQESEFIDASSNGDDVFISTTSNIHSEDEGLVDIYDARVGGGYAILAPPPECAGDACQSVPFAPADSTPASSVFNGPGNPRPLRNCRAPARRAGQLARKARRASSKQQRASLIKRAKRVRARAKRCRNVNRGGA